MEPSLQGCTDSCACNYDDFATVDDGSCDFTSCSGCTYPEADNYSTNALIDDGSCLFTNPCPADLNDDGSINTGDLLDFLAQYGSICPSALSNLPAPHTSTMYQLHTTQEPCRIFKGTASRTHCKP